MAKPLDRENLNWEAAMAAVNTSGVRPIVTDTVTVAASSEQTYTVADIRTMRLVVAHEGTGDLDIRVDIAATATATSFPIFAGVYFVFEVEKDDVIHFFNTSGSSIDIHLMETR